MTHAPTSRSGSGAGFVLMATVLFAFKGVIARVALETGITVVALVSLRVLFATPLYLGVSAALSREKTRPPVSPRTKLEAMAVGAFFLMAAACDFSAIDRIGAGPSRVILFSFPGVVLIIEAVRLRAWPRPLEVFTFALAWLGLVGVAAPDGLGALRGRDLSGVLFALGGSVTYAIFLTASQRSMRAMGSVVFTAYSNIGTAVALLLALPFVLSPADFVLNARGLAWLTLLVVACTVLPFLLLARGIERAGAGPASLLTLVGPPLTVVAAYFILGERLVPIQIAGATLVLASISFLKLRDHRRARVAKASADEAGALTRPADPVAT